MRWESVGFMCGIRLSVLTHEYLTSTFHVFEPTTFDTSVEEILSRTQGGGSQPPLSDYHKV